MLNSQYGSWHVESYTGEDEIVYHEKILYLIIARAKLFSIVRFLQVILVPGTPDLIKTKIVQS